MLSAAEVRLKDIARIEGIRENQLIGYGLIVGLPGTGDTRSKMTNESIQNYLKKFGISAEIKLDQSRNVASVLISADIPSYAKKGNRINVTVSSIGDAKSLEGGVLLQSPLKSATNEIIAVASGPIAFGGANLSEDSSSRKRNKNVGVVYNGAIVEKELPVGDFNSPTVKIILENQDFTNLNNIIKMIAGTLQTTTEVISPNQIEVKIPEKSNYIEFLSALENIRIENESKAKVVINERTGTIVIGGNVTVDEVAISRNGLSVTVVDTTGNEGLNEKKQSLFMFENGTSVSDVVDSLNKIGATTKDIVAILEGLKKSGAMHAELEIE